MQLTVHDAYIDSGKEGLIGRTFLYPVDSEGSDLRLHIVNDVKYNPSGKIVVVAERQDMYDCDKIGEIIEYELDSISHHAIF